MIFKLAAISSMLATAVTAADSDDGVVPGHGFRCAAALQQAPIGGKPRDRIIAEAADLWASAGKWTGLTR